MSYSPDLFDAGAEREAIRTGRNVHQTRLEIKGGDAKAPLPLLPESFSEEAYLESADDDWLLRNDPNGGYGADE